MVEKFNIHDTSPESSANKWEVSVGDLSQPEQVIDTPETVEDSKEASVAEALEDVHEALESESDHEKEAGIKTGDEILGGLIGKYGVKSEQVTTYVKGKYFFISTRFGELIPKGATVKTLQDAMIAEASGESVEHDLETQRFIDMMLQNTEVN